MQPFGTRVHEYCELVSQSSHPKPLDSASIQFLSGDSSTDNYTSLESKGKNFEGLPLLQVSNPCLL